MQKKRKKPDFIVIGPEKTGTSLLYRVLREHPDVSLPPRKEIRYWNEGEQIPRHNLFRVITSKHWHYKALRNMLRSISIQLLKDATASVLCRHRMDPILSWRLRYALGTRSSAWYESLFSDDGKLTGDISPLYYHVSDNKIRECHAHNPNAKIIVLVREPIERMWSKVRMNLFQHKGMVSDDFNYSQFHSFVKNMYTTWRPYRTTIEAWRSVFSDVHIALYDDLKNHPQQWFGKICAFLGIRETGFHLLAHEVNKGIDFEMPRVCEKILFDQYGGELKELGEHYHLSSWLKRYDELLSRD